MVANDDAHCFICLSSEGPFLQRTCDRGTCHGLLAHPLCFLNMVESGVVRCSICGQSYEEPPRNHVGRLHVTPPARLQLRGGSSHRGTRRSTAPTLSKGTPAPAIVGDDAGGSAHRALLHHHHARGVGGLVACIRHRVQLDDHVRKYAIVDVHHHRERGPLDDADRDDRSLFHQHVLGFHLRTLGGGM